MRTTLAWLAVLGAIGAVAWYVLRGRATAAPLTETDPDAVIADSLPSAPVTPGPVDVWRAAVVRASIRYRDASLAASAIVPGWADGQERLRIASIIARAATAETRDQLMFRLAFLRAPSLTAGSRIATPGAARDAAAELQAAWAGLAAAVAMEPAMALSVAVMPGAVARSMPMPDVYPLGFGPLEIRR